MRTLLLTAVFALLLLLGLVAWRLLSGRDSIEFPKREWRASVEREARRTRNVTTFTVFWNDLLRRIARRSPPQNHEIKQEHERALLRLGYLMTNDFVLTNQVLTLEFGSNFWRMLRDRFGTNRNSIWMYRFNRDRIYGTLPAKDLAEWERIFRECASRYASNVPPASVTNVTN